MAGEPKGKSPWARKQKRAYIYSDELNNWTAAIKKGDRAAADRFDRAWRNKFGISERRYIPDEADNAFALG
jgi:hypothetical protein